MGTVTSEQILQAAASLFDAAFWSRIFPSLTMLAVVIGLYWMIVKAQRGDPTFRAADFLRDEQAGGKASLKRLTIVGTWAVHSQFLLVLVVNAKDIQDLIWHAMLYAGVWSGTPLVLQGLAVWRGGSPPPPQEVKDGS